MTTTLQTRRGLDADVPTTGRAADAYEVACTAGVLQGRAIQSTPALSCARHATLLHIISGQLHRIAERLCNEDLTCPQCRGAGIFDPDHGTSVNVGPECRACAGRGTRLGRREARLERDARAIAEHYGLRAYFQGDPRGGSLYLIAPEIIPKSFLAANGAPTGESLYRDAEDWVRANYNRGYAVVRLG